MQCSALVMAVVCRKQIGELGQRWHFSSRSVQWGKAVMPQWHKPLIFDHNSRIVFMGIGQEGMKGNCSTLSRVAASVSVNAAILYWMTMSALIKGEFSLNNRKPLSVPALTLLHQFVLVTTTIAANGQETIALPGRYKTWPISRQVQQQIKSS